MDEPKSRDELVQQDDPARPPGASDTADVEEKPGPNVSDSDRSPARGPRTPSSGSHGDSERGGTDGEAVETYPEGGREAWLVVLGSWLALLPSLGIMNTLATFQTYISTHQLLGMSEGSIGWIFSLYTFLAFFLGVYIGPIFDKYGPRWLILVGTIFLFLGLMLLSICTGMFFCPPLLNLPVHRRGDMQ